MSAIKVELTKAVKIKQKKSEDDQAFFGRIVRAIGQADQEVWDGLSEDAQTWYNEAVDAMEAKTDIAGFGDVDADDATTSDEEGKPASKSKSKSKPAPAPKPEGNATGKPGGGKAFRTKLLEDPSKGLVKCFEEVVAEDYKISYGTAEIIYYETKQTIAVAGDLGLLKKKILL